MKMSPVKNQSQKEVSVLNGRYQEDYKQIVWYYNCSDTRFLTYNHQYYLETREIHMNDLYYREKDAWPRIIDPQLFIATQSWMFKRVTRSSQ